MDRDEHWMRAALALAQRAAEAGEVPIGAVLVDAADRVIAEGHNLSVASADPTAHAEIVAVRAACAALANYRLPSGLTLYVTLEPCVMCAGALSHARLSRLVYAAGDPKGGGVEHGPRYFESETCHWRPDAAGGVCADEAAALLKGFFRLRRA